jgi:beta-glucosidase
MFDPPASLPFANITPADNDTPEHNSLSERMARASMVLLKNEDNLLPLRGPPATIAVVGPNADSLDALLGNYYGSPSKPVTVLDGIRARFPGSRILYAQGVGLIGQAELPVPDTALCVDRRCRTRGLRAEHFSNPNLEGAPISTAVETNAAVTYEERRTTSARWTGFVTAAETGPHKFRFASQNGYRVWIGDTLVSDEWGVGDSPSIAAGAINLQQGRTYPIRVEGVQRGVRGIQRLLFSPPSQNGDDAVEAARNADVVIFVGGLTARVEGEEMRVEAPGFAGGDRTSLDLPAPQQQLLERLKATGKPIVLVLMSGSALGVNWADANIPAIVEAWYPGGRGGAAVAGLLAGDFSPSGRLPVTFYRSVDQLPAFNDYSMAGRTYRYFTGEALYPFGHGLSYTSFAYANPRVNRARIRAHEAITVSVDVRNTGAMDGDEIAQLYVTRPGIAGAPIRSLQGFQRVSLRKGETRTVQFELRDRALSVVDEQGVRRVPAGLVDVWIGGGQPVSRAGLAQPAGAQTRFRVTNAAELEN